MINPTVSILMITYNHEAYISQAIEGILMQKTNFRFVLIVADDFSNDNNQNIIRQITKENPEIIKPILRNENIGANQNWIDAFNYCTGKYIALCEGDDYWTDPYKLQKQVDFLEANENCGLIHTDVNIRNEVTEIFHGKVNLTIPLSHLQGHIFESLLNPYYYPMVIKTATVVFRSELLDLSIFRIGADRNWCIGDLPLWLDFSHKSSIGYLNEATAVYRIINESATQSKNIQKLYQVGICAIDIRKYFSLKYKAKHSTVNDIAKYSLDFYVGYARNYNIMIARTKAKSLYRILKGQLNLKKRIYYYAVFCKPLNVLLKLYIQIRIRLKF